MSVSAALTDAFNAVLVPEGFRRRSSSGSWHRLAGSMYAVVNVQPSRFDASCYVNIGFSPADHAGNGWLLEQKCHVRFRVDELKAVSVEDLALLDPEMSGRMGDASWRAALLERIGRPVADVVAGVRDMEDLSELLRTAVSARVFVHRLPARRHDRVGRRCPPQAAPPSQRGATRTEKATSSARTAGRTSG